jgi:hypothetical protein
VTSSVRSIERGEGSEISSQNNLIDLALVCASLLVVEVVNFHLVDVAQIPLTLHMACVTTRHGETSSSVNPSSN